MNNIKEAFFNVKGEMNDLREQISNLNKDLIETRKEMINICEIIKNISKKNESQIKTNNQEITTNENVVQTYNSGFKPLNTNILPISIGNEGVQTDRQTIRQTDRQSNFEQKTNKTTINNAIEILDSLNSIKKELRLKFKKLTEQELLVFSKMYQLDEEKGFSDYKTLSKELGLTQSSIRDYVGRLILKEIPIEKTKLNNKSVQLKISENLKKIATLPTILKLREL